MTFGVNTYIWGATFGPADFHLLPRIKAAGFDGIEVPILDPVGFEADGGRPRTGSHRPGPNGRGQRAGRVEPGVVRCKRPSAGPGSRDRMHQGGP